MLRLKRNSYYDYALLAVIVILMCFGLVMLYSVSSYTAEIKTGDDMFYFKKQAFFCIFGLIVAILFSFGDYHWFYKLGTTLYLISIVLMLLVRTPLGTTYNGARRWLGYGRFSFQPAEVAKIAVIVFIPIIIIKMGSRYKGLKATLIPFVLGLIPALCAYVFTENLSTAIIIMAITCVVMFVAHPKTAPFIILLVILALVVFAGIYILKHYADTGSSFRIRRILVWLEPEKYQSEGGYQIIQGLYALGSGGLFGKGLGNSTQKLGFVPEATNDMIYPIICEELGVFGGVIVLGLYAYILYRLLFISQNAKDKYGSLIACGIFAHIALQVILNICVVTNIIPTTGITLPFISYGGTSVVFLMFEIAIALSISRQIVIKREEVNMWGGIENY